MSRIHPLLFVLALVFASACAPPSNVLTPMDTPSMTTRKYELDQKIVFLSVLKMLDDLGYTTIDADETTGLISAESKEMGLFSDIDTALGPSPLPQGTIQTVPESDMVHRSYVAKYLYAFVEVPETKATGVVETIGNITSVRLSFVEISQISPRDGNSKKQDTPILDAKLYQNAFEKIEAAIRSSD